MMIGSGFAKRSDGTLSYTTRSMPYQVHALTGSLLRAIRDHSQLPMSWLRRHATGGLGTDGAAARHRRGGGAARVGGGAKPGQPRAGAGGTGPNGKPSRGSGVVRDHGADD